MPDKHLSQKTRLALWLTIIVFLILFGIGLMLYPLISSQYMESVRSEIHTEYEAQMADSNEAELQKLRDAAHAYNARLASGELSILHPEENGYDEQMIVPGSTSIMGYVHIPKINVHLPIYHGVDSDALSAGCGHMPQSSLPVGGPSTHSVISAHTGMASAKMFSDLPILEVGDTFQLETLGELLTYEIQSQEDIKTVLPVEVKAIQIKLGADLATLVTCTPIGINTHRLLITGHRIPTPDTGGTVAETIPTTDGPKRSVWQEEYINAIKTGIMIILLILTVGGLFIGIYAHHQKGLYEKSKEEFNVKPRNLHRKTDQRSGSEPQ